MKVIDICVDIIRDFYKHEYVKQYQYYWRIEPGIKIYCDLNYDVFKYMNENNKNMDLLYHYLNILKLFQVYGIQ